MNEANNAFSTSSPPPATRPVGSTPIMSLFQIWVELVERACDAGLSTQETTRLCALSNFVQDSLLKSPIQSDDDFGALMWAILHNWGDAGALGEHPCALRGGRFDEREGQLAAATLIGRYPQVAAIAEKKLRL